MPGSQVEDHILGRFITSSMIYATLHTTSQVVFLGKLPQERIRVSKDWQAAIRFGWITVNGDKVLNSLRLNTMSYDGVKHRR